MDRRHGDGKVCLRTKGQNEIAEMGVGFLAAEITALVLRKVENDCFNLIAASICSLCSF